MIKKAPSKKVLVTGVGGGVGQSILKSFQGSQYSVVAADADPLATGLYAAPLSYRIPRADAPDFLTRIIEICKKESCSLIFCGIEPELHVFAAATAGLRAQGIIPVVSSPQVVATCDDKLETNRFLRAHRFTAPVTVMLDDPGVGKLPLPVVLKPRKGGARSQGVFVVRTSEELKFRRATLDVTNYIAQEQLAGEEYTCGTVTFDGRCHGVITMRRTLRDGDTYKAFVVERPIISEHVREVAEALKPIGPCNFQLRLKDGKPCIFEINSRCSGTTYCRSVAGFNEPVMTADYLLAGKQPSFKIREMSFLRYWKELAVSNESIRTLQQEGTISGDGSEL
jgi:carbamoyl-phosphate synthase large subunit